MGTSAIHSKREVGYIGPIQVNTTVSFLGPISMNVDSDRCPVILYLHALLQFTIPPDNYDLRGRLDIKKSVTDLLTIEV